MGQYYKPIFFRKEAKIAEAYEAYYEQGYNAPAIEETPIAALYSHLFKRTYVGYYGEKFTCGIGLKLMEHSYVGNLLCRAAEHLLANEYAGCPIVWAGDYGDNVFINPRSDEDEKTSAYDLSTEGLEEKTYDALPARKVYNRYHRYIINHDTHEYVEIPKRSKKEYRVHPLPLLTCNGNGRGGGDYRITDGTASYEEYIGKWCGHHLSVANEVPSGYTKLDIVFPLDD